MKTGIRLTAAVLISLFVISAAGCANEKSLSSETGGHTDSSQTPPAAADILKKAMIDIYNEFNEKKLKSKMLLQVHDELIFNVLKDEEDVVKEIVDRCMDDAYKLDVPLKVDIETGDNWYDAK